ncbi:MAG: PAS domain S-box protein [Sideroxyarcus sp.]|nr:PAS domain S-box protein [Sideroxyarcus sp.]
MKESRKLYAWMTGAVLLVALVVATSISAFKQIADTAAIRQHTFQVLEGTNELFSALQDAETSQRGYLLSGDDALLAPYSAASKGISNQLEELRRITLLPAAQQHLDVFAPLINDLLDQFSASIDKRRRHELRGELSDAQNDHGRRLMDTIRTEIREFVQVEQALLTQREVEFQSSMRYLLAFMLFMSLLTLLFALAFVYMAFRKEQQYTKNLMHAATQDLLADQLSLNEQLHQTNLDLQNSEGKLSVTLNSIGDAVLATDGDGRVTLLNPIAETLTGWKHEEAVGRPVDEIFRIINQETREPATIPVIATLAHGTIQGLANHTVLIARDGSECAIADSCAPIRDSDRKVVGAVLVFRNVTKEYVVQQALRDNAALIQTILNTVVDGVVTLHARGGMVETMNPAAERMFGYSAAELIGQDFSTLIPELNQDQRNGSLEYYSASVEARASGLGREVTGRRKDGSIFPMEIAVSEMRLGGERYFTGILRDISTRKQVEAALVKADALQNAIFNSANFSSIATDAKGVIQIFNVGAERMLGYTAADVMNKITPADISDPQEVIARAKALSAELGTPITPGFEALVFKASRGIEDIYELTYIRKDGSRFPAVVSVTALRDAQNTIIGYLLIGTDNTARKLVEAERAHLYQVLQDKNTDLQIAVAAADKANLAKSDFLSKMSHELRTPLNAILGFGQLLEADSPTPAQAKRLHQITKAGWYLLELINEILDLAVIESGRLSLSPESVSLLEVMHECQAMIEAQAVQRGIKINFQPFDESLHANVDRIRIKQVLINLLSNAIKYNRDHGTVEVMCAASAPERIRISIKDSGAGLSPEQQAQLFQPFNRLGKENGIEEGTGIGLVVTKQLVELMGGEIGVHSTVGVGSEFWIELKQDSAPRLASGLSMPTALSTGLAANGAQHTLLYVEDNPANLMLVEQIIKNQPNLRMLSARDGTLGIALARAELPNVILMDINLPGINGFQALEILREDPTTAHIPVIALSANAMLRDVEKGIDAGFFRYLTKPIKIDEFMDALDGALKLSESGMCNTSTCGVVS